MKSVFGFLLTMALVVTAYAGVRGYSGKTDLKQFDSIQCSTGMTCTRASGKLKMVSAPVGGLFTNYTSWNSPLLTSGTSTTPSATTVYLSQMYLPVSVTLTGIKISNGATVGTNKYVVALFNSAGTPVANSALAGATTAGADVYQTLAFTTAYAAVPGVYWVGLYVDGTTDRFRSIPAAGVQSGLAGSVTGQTFGTVAAVTLPTTFTADKGPVFFTY